MSHVRGVDAHPLQQGMMQIPLATSMLVTEVGDRMSPTSLADFLSSNYILESSLNSTTNNICISTKSRRNKKFEDRCDE